MSQRFDGSTVLVTGGSRGLGRAIALGFADEGAYVFVGYRSGEDQAKETLAQLREAGGDGHPWQIDVRDDASVEQAVKAALAARGTVEVLVNNAAVLQQQLFALAGSESWQHCIDVNLGGTLRCCQAVARPMMAAGGGSIVNIASVAALRAADGLAAYAASKGGVIAFTRSLARELAPKGVRVNGVAAGYVTTGMGARLDREVVERRRTSIPLGRFADPSEIARAVLFVASDDGSYLVGQILVVDGGLSL